MAADIGDLQPRRPQFLLQPSSAFATANNKNCCDDDGQAFATNEASSSVAMEDGRARAAEGEHRGGRQAQAVEGKGA